MNSITEEKIEKRIDKIDTIKYHRLKKMCQDIADFLNENGTPHTSVSITQNDFVIKEDVVNGYLEDKE